MVFPPLAPEAPCILYNLPSHIASNSLPEHRQNVSTSAYVELISQNNRIPKIPLRPTKKKKKKNIN